MLNFSDSLKKPISIAQQLLGGQEAWLVGGLIRDTFLGRETTDIDITLRADLVKSTACKLAKEMKAAVFCLSDEFGSWRVVAHDHTWQVDFMPLAGETIMADLACRDCTINAIAQPLAGGELIDPFSGQIDLEQQRVRLVSEQAVRDDPLRILRVARFACELGFQAENETMKVAARHAGRLSTVAGERIFTELKRIIASENPVVGLELCRQLSVLKEVFPEFLALEGVEQNIYHHLDVYDHTIEVLRQVLVVEKELYGVPGNQKGWLKDFLGEPLAEEVTRSTALRLGALFHDIAKPRVRAIDANGQVTFFDHDAQGAELAYRVLKRWRASERLRRHIAGLTRHHLALGFLVYQQPFTRHDLYTYLQRCGDVAVDVTLLSVADRLATRGKNAENAVKKHLEFAGCLFSEVIEHCQFGFAGPLLRGEELMAELGLQPGPKVGQLVEQLQEAQFTGEVKTHADAVRFLQGVL